MGIRDLIKGWREPGYGAEIKTICANELERAMPKWTTVTDDPDTWPALDPEYGVHEFEVVARFPNKDGSMGGLEAFEWDESISLGLRVGDAALIGGVWRYADTYDAPPKQAGPAKLTEGLK